MQFLQILVYLKREEIFEIRTTKHFFTNDNVKQSATNLACKDLREKSSSKSHLFHEV